MLNLTYLFFRILGSKPSSFTYLFEIKYSSLNSFRVSGHEPRIWSCFWL